MENNIDIDIVRSTDDQTPIEALLHVGEDGKVSARSTYSFLGLGARNFARWAKANILDNDFSSENEDYYVVFIDADDIVMPNGGTVTRESVDYRLSVPFAKKLCMLARSERGEQARDYFIKVEETLKHVSQALPQLTTNEMILQLAQANVQLERDVHEAREEVREVREEVRGISGKFDTAIKVLSAPSIDHWRADMEAKINEMVETYGLSPLKFRGCLYAELEQTANVKLGIRIRRMQERMKKQGITYVERRALTKLDVISKSRQLRPIFEAIVKKTQAVYAARQ